MRRGESKFYVGVDIGGTFTDIVILDNEGSIRTKKVSSTVDDYALAIIDGISEVFKEIGADYKQISELVHGTTVASNAILEHNGARIGLIGTKGFRDILEIRNLRMPRLYDLAWEKPKPLIERYLRVVVDERVDSQGNIVRPLEKADAERAVDQLLKEGVEGIVVCLINSYANPVHEKLLADVIRERAPKLSFCISFDVLPEIKEYERTSTTVINGYIMPVVSKYLTRLRLALEKQGMKTPVLLMQSNGGLTTAEEASLRPVNIVESGPAAGVVAAASKAVECGHRDIISFDMGGTTAKASLVEDGKITRSQEYSVGGGIMISSRLLTGGGYLLKVPAIDLAEVGAGGGSIVWIDGGGSMQIGPESAGSSPGPLCYDRGGDKPTVTDANLVLGYINPNHLVGGELKLNADKCRHDFEQNVAVPLGIDLAQAAYGARQIALSRMIRAIKAVSSERGRDPRSYALIAFGGNGPMFAAGMARELSMSKIIVPPFAGLFSSYGLLCAEIEHHYSKTANFVLRDSDPEKLEEIWRGLEILGCDQLAADGFDRDQMSFPRSANMRYKGQSYELTVSTPDTITDRSSLLDLERTFADEYEYTYGHRASADEPVEVISVQVHAIGTRERVRVSSGNLLDSGSQASELGSRKAYFGKELGWIETPVISRNGLAKPRNGPCIVEEYDSTCLIPPESKATLDGHGNIVVEL